MIYLDYSATSINKPKQMIDAVSSVLSAPLGNPSRGSGSHAISALRLLNSARQSIAEFFGLKEYWRLGFTSGGTHSLNLAIKGLIPKNSHVITSTLEHNSVLRPLYQMQDDGLSLSVIPANDKGELDIEKLPSLLQKNTSALVVNLMSNVTGRIAPFEVYKNFAKENGLYLILDASQAAGVIPLEFAENDSNILLAITGHKSLYGPRGIGALLSFGIDSLKPLISGGSGIHSFDREHPKYFPDVCEAGTLNLPFAVGLSESIKYLSSRDRKKDFEQLKFMRNILFEEASKIPNIKVYGTLENSSAIVSLNIGDMPSGEAGLLLEEKYGILTRTGAHCAPLIHEALGTKEQGAVRFSLGLSSSYKDIECCIVALRELAKEQTI